MTAASSIEDRIASSRLLSLKPIAHSVYPILWPTRTTCAINASTMLLPTFDVELDLASLGLVPPEVPFRHPDHRSDVHRLERQAQDPIPAFALAYDPNRQIIRAVDRLVLFLPEDQTRTLPVRVTERTWGPAKWYEVETYHSNMEKWIQVLSRPSLKEALERAQNVGLQEAAA